MRAKRSTRGRSQSLDESNDTTGSARPVEERPIECQPLVGPRGTHQRLGESRPPVGPRGTHQRSGESAATCVDRTLRTGFALGNVSQRRHVCYTGSFDVVASWIVTNLRATLVRSPPSEQICPDVSRTLMSSASHVSQSGTCVRHCLTRTLDHRLPGSEYDPAPGAPQEPRRSGLATKS